MLGEVLKRFTPPTSDRLLVGIDGVDDAGVFQLTETLALVQTVDFFPPIVDDPFTFGQVAAANALSDVYAMGGTPITALNILGFPAGLSPDLVGDILQGGADKIAEAGAVIVGGHSVKDKELKYGLAVTGTIDTRRIITNSGARPGDVLILTKPIGTGIICTAVKQGKASDAETEAVVASMISLNKVGAEVMSQFMASAATDITGFGLGGHVYEMASASGVTLEIEFSKVKLLPGTIAHAQAGALTGGANANRDHLVGKISIAEHHPTYVHDIIYDAQTSGGLLIAIGSDRADDTLAALLDGGVDAAVIGQAVTKGQYAVVVK